MPEFSSEVRRDPIYGHEVIIAPARMERPNSMECESWDEDDPSACPFCLGREGMTPQSILELPRGLDNWQVRVIPNRYPVLSAAAGNGAHEVIVESPDHVAGLLELTESQRQLVFEAYQSRFQHYAQLSTDDGPFCHGLLFKNHGRVAGASQYHIHSQFVAFPSPMDALRRVAARSQARFEQTGRCVFCESLEREVHCEERLVAHSEDFIAFCPAASRCAYEIWILPRQHESRFECLDASRLRKFCQFASLTLARLEKTIQHVAYNFAIHSAPFDSSFDQHYHWHMVISPRIAGIAGFELSTNVFINPVDPVVAASHLRDSNVSDI